jgi:hypothetical protein
MSLRSLMQGPRPTEEAMLSAIDLEKLLAVERATVEKGQT